MLRDLRLAEDLRRREREAADKGLAALRREIVELTTRRDEQLLAFQTVPEVVEEMFRVRSRREVPPMLVRLVDALLKPEQVAVFVARPAERRLALVEGQGLGAALPAGTTLGFGEGRAGYVAENLVAMDDADFRGARGEGTTRALDLQRALTGNDPRELRVDAAAPVLAGTQAFAVVTVGGARLRKGLEKRLLSMAAGMAAAAADAADTRRASEQASSLDGMTGVLNRRALEARLEEEIRRAEREEGTLSLLLLDVDDLRHYNQTNGHQQGDDVLRRLATLLKGAIRAQDVLARFGGEEFAIVFPGADKATAMRLGENLRQAVEAFPFPFRGLQPQGSVTMSAGVATWPEDSKVARELVRCADQAMLEAKREGRNRVLPAEPSYLT